MIAGRDRLWPPAAPDTMPRGSFMETEPVFDAHCHVFNLEYLLLEVTQILWDMIRGTYPLPTDTMIEDTVAIRPDFELKNPLDAAEHLAGWIMEIGMAAFQSEAANVREIRRTAARTWKARTIGLVPLMMDIYFMFAPPLGPEASDETGTSRSTGVPGDDPRDERARALRKRIARAIRGVHERMTHGARPRRWPAIERLAAAGIERVLRQHARPAGPGGRSFRPTAGFSRQLRALSVLGRSGTGIYPFFAVDARREGAVEWAITSGQIGPRGPFYGVKLYPRLGCHPLRPELAPLFAHCARNGIPITTHASENGFPDFLTKHAEFGNPDSFRPIFERHPGIRIDFAHFGDRPIDAGTGTRWGRSIADLMRDFPGAFSDLSCYTHEAALERFTTQLQDLPNVRERTMFGSDFNVLYFTEPGMTLEKYYRRFLEYFGRERLVGMASRAPRVFLGLPPVA
jgi:predicted TIM-barrel fold metal-dependent hydrolase